MAFSVNQVNHLFVATKVGDKTTDGDLIMKETKEKELYFQKIHDSNEWDYQVVASDKIPLSNILHASLTEDKSMTRLPTIYKVLAVTTEQTDIIAGQDYILRITISQYLGMSDEDVYMKYGAVRTTAAMVKKPSLFYIALAKSLYKNFSREPHPLLYFGLEREGAVDMLTPATINNDFTKQTYNNLIIVEAPQEWRRGVLPQVPVYYEVAWAPINVDGVEIKPGVAYDVAKPFYWQGEKLADGASIDEITTYLDYTGVKPIFNGKQIADLEWFLMGERADQYRGVSWPHNIETRYEVNPEGSYHLLNIHYAYIGPNEGPQKSEKDITIACEDLEQLKKVENYLTDNGIKVTHTPESE